MKIKDIVSYLNELAPPSLQESYDNCGLIVGDPNMECKGIVTCLDSIESVIEEAIESGCNMVVAHHPIVFGGLKKFNGSNYIERTVIKAIKHDIAIFAIHTNLDNVKYGVNGVFADALKLKNQKILGPKKSLLNKLVFYVPVQNKEEVLDATFNAGAGGIGEYSECSFSSQGTGTFKPSEVANPAIGNANVRESVKEDRVEVVVESHNLGKVISALTKAHPYEEVAHEIIKIENSHTEIGSGMIGELENEIDLVEWLSIMKDTMNAGVVRYTDPHKRKVKKVAICGGSGSFLLNTAIRSGADVFVTADYKYHQFFDADGQITIADIGHFESEHLTINYLAEKLKEKFTTFAVLLTKENTNPIKYL